MIGYHPAVDPYHTAFRLLRLLVAIGQPIDRSALRIMDFFLLFPETVGSIKLPQEHVSWRSRLKRPPNPYWLGGDRDIVFDQMDAVQDGAIRLLAAAGIVEESGVHGHDLLLMAVPDHLLTPLRSANEREPELMSFMVEVLAPLHLRGAKGLKDRTGLMEHRYDPTS